VVLLGLHYLQVLLLKGREAVDARDLQTISKETLGLPHLKEVDIPSR